MITRSQPPKPMPIVAMHVRLKTYATTMTFPHSNYIFKAFNNLMRAQTAPDEQDMQIL